MNKKQLLKEGDNMIHIDRTYDHSKEFLNAYFKHHAKHSKVQLK